MRKRHIFHYSNLILASIIPIIASHPLSYFLTRYSRFIFQKKRSSSSIVRPVGSFESLKVEGGVACQEKLAEDFHDHLECFCGNDPDEDSCRSYLHIVTRSLKIAAPNFILNFGKLLYSDEN